MWPFRKKSPQERLAQARIELAGVIARRDAISDVTRRSQSTPVSLVEEMIRLSQYAGELGEWIRQTELEIGAPNV